jgi:hypothetical protein
MSRIIKCGLIQAHNHAPTAEIKKINNEIQLKMIDDAAKKGVQMLCF